MTKKDMIAKLKDADVEFDSTMTADELMAAHPDILVEEGDKEVGARALSNKADGGVRAAVNKDGQIIFKIRNQNVHGGMSERVFCEETHGEDFQALADEFAETNKNIIIG